MGKRRRQHRRRPANKVLERCAGCDVYHPLSAMIAWRAGMWCLACTDDELQAELAGVRRDTAAAVLEERRADRGQSFVRGEGSG